MQILQYTERIYFGDITDFPCIQYLWFELEFKAY